MRVGGTVSDCWNCNIVAGVRDRMARAIFD